MWKVLYFTIHTKRLFSKAIIWKVTGVLDKVCTRHFIFQCAPKREWRFEKGWPDLSIRKLLTRSNSYSFGHVQNEPRPISNMNHDLLTTPSRFVSECTWDWKKWLLPVWLKFLISGFPQAKLKLILIVYWIKLWLAFRESRRWICLTWH